MVYGRDANEIRKDLLSRGWVEKLPPAPLISKFNLKCGETSQEAVLLSSFLKDYDPNFVWAGRLSQQYYPFQDNIFDAILTNSKKINSNKKVYSNDDTIVSRLKVNIKFWCSKTGLCTSLKDTETSWHYIKNVAEIYAPRTYANEDRDDLIDFVNDYLLTACTSLLRWTLDNLYKGVSILKRTGTVSTNVMIFALNRCKEYLNIKENKDVDGAQSRAVTPGQWNFFIKKHQSLTSGQEVFKLDNQQYIPLLVVYAHYLLKAIIKYRPQLSCEGCHNVWIIKPSNLSMGAGISISSHLHKILNKVTRTKEKYVVQKYIGKNYSTYL